MPAGIYQISIVSDASFEGHVDKFYEQLDHGKKALFDKLKAFVLEQFSSAEDDLIAQNRHLMCVVCGVLSYDKLKGILLNFIRWDRPLRVANFACGSDYSFPVFAYICSELELEYECYVGFDIDNKDIKWNNKYYSSSKKAHFACVDATKLQNISDVLVKLHKERKLNASLGFDVLKLEHPEINSDKCSQFIQMIMNVMPHFASPSAYLYVATYTTREMQSVLCALANADASAQEADYAKEFCHSEYTAPATRFICENPNFTNEKFNALQSIQSACEPITESTFNVIPIVAGKNGVEEVVYISPFSHQVVSPLKGFCLHMLVLEKDDYREKYRATCREIMTILYKADSFCDALECCKWLVTHEVNIERRALAQFNAGRCCVQIKWFDSGITYFNDAVLELRKRVAQYAADVPVKLQKKLEYYEASRDECNGFLKYQEGDFAAAKDLLSSAIARFKALGKKESRYQAALNLYDVIDQHSTGSSRLMTLGFAGLGDVMSAAVSKTFGK